MRLFQSTPMNHTPHILASVFLCGLWLPVWIAIAISHTPTWRCAFCGYSNYTADLADPQRASRLAAEAQANEAAREYRRETGTETLGDKIADNPVFFAVGIVTVVLIVIAAIFILIGAAADKQSQHPTNTASNANTSPQPDCKLPANECQYLSGAFAYLTRLRDGDEKFAVVMAGLSNGSSTLTEIQTELGRVSTTESAAYFGSYSKTKPPKGYEVVGMKIKDIHQMHTSAFDEYGKYLTSHDPAYIESGSSRFKLALPTIKETITTVNQIMDGKLKALDLDSKPHANRPH